MIGELVEMLAELYLSCEAHIARFRNERQIVVKCTYTLLVWGRANLGELKRRTGELVYISRR